MTRYATCVLLVLLGCCAVPVWAADGPRVTTVEMGIPGEAKDTLEEVTSEFEPDTAKILCLWKAQGFGATTTIRGVWIAENVGKAAPPNFKIDEATMLAPFMNQGTFSLSKPNKGFPPGKYRLEIYIGKDLAKTIPFTVVAG